MLTRRLTGEMSFKSPVVREGGREWPVVVPASGGCCCTYGTAHCWIAERVGPGDWMAVTDYWPGGSAHGL